MWIMGEVRDRGYLIEIKGGGRDRHALRDCEEAAPRSRDDLDQRGGRCSDERQAGGGGNA